MRKKALVALACCLGLSVLSGVSPYARKKVDPSRQFHKLISRNQRIAHALDRLTFGPRPGDIEKVRAIGLKKWIDRQLHPETIAENSELGQKLKILDSLSMSSEQMVQNYPTPQVVRLMVRGIVPYPSDPGRRAMIQKEVQRFEARLKAGQNPNLPEPPRPLNELLSRAEVRSLRTGTPQYRMAAFEALPKETQDQVLVSLPGGIRQALFTAAPPDLRRRIELTAGPQQIVSRDLQEGKLLRGIYSNRQLQEVLTDFWFNHFNIYLDKGADRYLVTEYERDVIRPHVLGKFRDLLEATAKSPAMLYYLDNWQSVGPNTALARRARKTRAERGLNENYGRELMELHTLGVNGGYTQKDVIEVARCFSGWTISNVQRGGTFVFNPRLHDKGQKVVLGITIPAGGGIEDGEEVLDILAHHPSTAHFICRELAQRFVADDPPESLVDRMAKTFLKTDGDLREVMKTMLNSKEFWSVGAYRTKIKSPLEFVAGAVRAVNGDVDYALGLANEVALLGEPLYRKVEPTGYSNASEEWANSAGLLARMNFALQLGNNKVPGVKVEVAKAAMDLGSPEFQKK